MYRRTDHQCASVAEFGRDRRCACGEARTSPTNSSSSSDSLGSNAGTDKSNSRTSTTLASTQQLNCCGVNHVGRHFHHQTSSMVLDLMVCEPSSPLSLLSGPERGVSLEAPETNTTLRDAKWDKAGNTRVRGRSSSLSTLLLVLLRTWVPSRTSCCPMRKRSSSFPSSSAPEIGWTLANA